MLDWCKNNPEKVKDRGLKIRKENHYLWQGGSSILNQEIRKSTRYRVWQNKVKDRDGRQCVNCGAKKPLETHHLERFKNLLKKYNITSTYEAHVRDELWDINNGITLCNQCHNQLHNDEDK